MIKIGLVGAGFMGGMHAECYKALAGAAEFQVTAVADVNRRQAEKLAEAFGAEVYRTAEEMFEQGDVNTVDICLPTFLHKDVALNAMERGYDVFIEKPVCLNRAEAAELLRRQRATGVRVMVGQCIRFWPEYVKLTELIEQRSYGKLVSGVFRRLSPRPEWGWEHWLHDEKKSGSAVLDLHIHDVDYVRSVLGEPSGIKSEIVRRGNAKTHIHSIYRYEDAVVSLEGGWDFPSSFPFEMSYTVHFEQAEAVFHSNATPTLRIYEADGRVVVPAAEPSGRLAAAEGGGNISSLGGYYNELNDFLHTISQGRDIGQSTLEDGCKSLDLLLRAMEAAEHGDRGTGK